MVVEVSPWTQANTRGFSLATAAAISAVGTVRPQGAETTKGVAPQRSAISVKRPPNRPQLAMTMASPGSSSDTRAASIAARAVPSISRVQRFCVSNTWR